MTRKQYRKKPVTIEAVQFDGLNPTEIKDFVGENCKVEIYDNKVTPPVASIVIHTLEGDMEVSSGDYVIKGVKDEFYPCKPDIFEQTYESAETQKELEEAAEEYTDSSEWLIGENLEHIEAAFIAGAQWQKDSVNIDISKQIAAAFQLGRKAKEEQMLKDGNVILTEEDFDAEKEKSMEWGYNLCKEQMLKEAVEGTVMDFSSNRPRPQVDVLLDPHKYHTGDKVRIIIVKEDEQ